MNWKNQFSQNRLRERRTKRLKSLNRQRPDARSLKSFYIEVNVSTTRQHGVDEGIRFQF